MSFLIVIVFFMLFAIIILTEVFMIDDKVKPPSYGSSSSSGFSSNSRPNSYSRFGESIPDYEDVKDEYSIEDAVFMRNRYNRVNHGKSLFAYSNK